MGTSKGKAFFAIVPLLIVCTLTVVFILSGSDKEVSSRLNQTPLSPSSQGPTSSSVFPSKNPLGILRVSYIDVGQGDSVLIELPNGNDVLIDAGEHSAGETVVAYLQKQGITRLDSVIWTHPHADHIGGADLITKTFDIGRVYMPNVSSNTTSYRELLTSMNKKGLRANKAKAGLTLDFGQGIKAEILAPNSSSYEETNDFSAVLSLTYGETSFLFTGDAQVTSEKEMLAAGRGLHADVLKIGHHGSHSSTSPAFLSKVQPKYAVISVGKGNDYGHPHQETLSALSKAGIHVYRTDESGTIVAESNGKTLTFITLGGH